MPEFIGDKERLILKDCRAGTLFAFGGRAAPTTINNLLRAGAIERVAENDPYWAPGRFRFTRTGAHIGTDAATALATHRITIVPAPKMDTPGLVAAECSCGHYRSSSTTEHEARKRGIAHAFNIGVKR
jgi:hypothetical protein